MTGEEKVSFPHCLWRAMRSAMIWQHTASAKPIAAPPAAPLSIAETIMNICDTFANTNPIIIASRPSVNRLAKFSQIQKDPNGSLFV